MNVNVINVLCFVSFVRFACYCYVSQTKSIEAALSFSVSCQMSVNVNIWQGSPVSSSRCWGRRWWGASGRAGGCSPGSSSRALAPSCSARDCSPRCSLKRGQRSILTFTVFWTKVKVMTCSKIFVLFTDIDNLLWLLSEGIYMRSILRDETQDIFSRQKILTYQPLRNPKILTHKDFIIFTSEFYIKGCDIIIRLLFQQDVPIFLQDN